MENEMKKPIICLLGDGSSTHIQRIALALEQRGYCILIMTGSHHHSDELHQITHAHPHIQVQSFNSKFPVFKKIHAMRKILKDFKVDILHSHYVNHGGYAGFLTGFHPHIISAWGDDIWLTPKMSLAHRMGVITTLRSSDLNLPVSSQLHDEIVRLTHKKIPSLVWNWGVDTEHFKSDAEKIKLFRKKIGIQAEELLVYSPRLLLPDYFHELLIEAWPEVLSKLPNARLVIKKTCADAIYESQLQAKIETLRLRDQIIWLENLSFQDLATSFSAADLMVSLPVTEGTPMSILEALSCETLVLATDIPEVREWVIPTKTGALTLKNPPAIAKKIIELLTLSPENKKEMGRLGRSLVIQKAGREKSFDDLEKIYAHFFETGSKLSFLKTTGNLFLSNLNGKFSENNIFPVP